MTKKDKYKRITVRKFEGAIKQFASAGSKTSSGIPKRPTNIQLNKQYSIVQGKRVAFKITTEQVHKYQTLYISP